MGVLRIQIVEDYLLDALIKGAHNESYHFMANVDIYWYCNFGYSTWLVLDCKNWNLRKLYTSF